MFGPTQNSLESFKDSITEYAADIVDLRGMTDEDVADLAAETKMPRLVERRFRAGLAQVGAAVQKKEKGQSDLVQI